MNQPILEVTTPGAGRRRPRRVSVHRTRSLSRSDLTTVDGIPVTRPARSVIDLASVLEPDRLEEALDSALRQGLTSVPHLRRRLHALGAKGRAGTELLGALLDRRDGQRPSESPPELALRRLFLAAGLPEPVPQYELRDGGRLIARFDWAYPDRRIAAEYNSFRHHHGRQAWDRDQARYNRPTALGWLVFTFTDADLRDSARGAIADLCRAYERRVAPSCDSTAAMH